MADGREIVVRMPKLHAAQKRMEREAKRFNVACMGRRFGKTKFGVKRMGGHALDGKPVAWFAPTYKLLDEVYRETVTRLAPAISDKNKSEKRIQLLTGGVIDFWTLDDEDPARGRKYWEIYVDEAAMVRGLIDKWLKSIRPTLTDYRGGAWFFSTPKGANDFKELYQKAGTNPDEWARWQMPTASNPHISAAEIEAARLDMPQLIYEQEYLAQFVDFSGAVVKREYLQFCDAPPRDQMAIAMGVDLAISTKDSADYTAVVVIGREIGGLRRTIILDAQRGRMGFHESMRFIQSMAQKWKPRVIGVEQVQYQAAAVEDLLVRTSLPVVAMKPDKDKLTRFQPLLARYEQKLIWHSNALPVEFEQELLTFTGDGPEKKDQVDAATYAFGLLPSTKAMDFLRTGSRDNFLEQAAADVTRKGWGILRSNDNFNGFL